MYVFVDVKVLCVRAVLFDVQVTVHRDKFL